MRERSSHSGANDAELSSAQSSTGVTLELYSEVCILPAASVGLTSLLK
jgi:hypothetical protein